MKRIFKLLVAAVAGGGAFLLFLVVTNNKLLYATARCLRAAPSILHCYGNKPFDFTTDFFGLRYEGSSRNYLDQQILSYGAYEKHLLFFLRDVAEAGAKGTFVDVGANTGEYSLYMARHAAAVHAFEPYEPIIERLRRNVAINQLANITIHPVGLGNEDAKVPFYKPPDFNEGSGSFIPNYSGENSNYHELTIVKGDEELAGAGEISLIKIDVQGFEKEVLAGMKATLAKNRSIILCELTVRPAAPFGFKSKSEILAVLPDNYRLLSFDMRDFDLFLGRYALIEFDREVDFTRDAFYEFVAYPIEKETQISLSGPKRRYED